MYRTIEMSTLPAIAEGLAFVTVKSEALRQRADLTIYVPHQARRQRDAPIVILLHGVYGSHWAWAFKGNAHLTAQRLIDAGAIPPMVLAMPSDGLWGDGSGYVPHATQDFERWVVEEVPAAVCAAVSNCSISSPLFIAGLSMGGFGALRMAGKYPQRFKAAAAHSSFTDAVQLDTLIAESRADWSRLPIDTCVLAALESAGDTPLPPLRFDCGCDDPFLEANRELHQALLARGIAHQYAENPGGHDWAYWSQHLGATLRFFGSTWPLAANRLMTKSAKEN